MPIFKGQSIYHAPNLLILTTKLINRHTAVVTSLSRIDDQEPLHQIKTTFSMMGKNVNKKSKNETTKVKVTIKKEDDVRHKHYEEGKGVKRSRTEQSDLHQAETASGEPAPPGLTPDLSFEESTNTHLKK